MKCGYVAFYNKNRYEVYSEEGIYDAKLQVQALAKKDFPKINVKTSDINIALAEKEGEDVVHTPDI